MSENEAPKSTVYTRTLRLAAETVGGVDRLALRLSIEQAALEGWIAGTDFPPHKVFLDALDIVASGSLVEPNARRYASQAQKHADRLQASANRAREAAERVQRHADIAQERSRKLAEKLDPLGDSGKVRQVKPKDSAPASNKPEEKKKNEG